MNVASFTVGDVQAKAFFDEHGWVLVDTLAAAQITALRAWTDEISGWRDEDGEWLQYREQTEFGPKLCRTENFTPFHAGMRALLSEGVMLAAATLLLGEPAVLYKEKINYKLMGGAGYAPHQDAPAYPFIDQHVSCMLAIDAADHLNGCLEVVSARHHSVLPMNDVGCITAAVVDELQWLSAPLQAGQTLWFHSRTPHRSGANHSQQNRRAIYPTYNALSEGDLRAAYYAEKRAVMASQRVGDNVQVSLIGDFQGRPVKPKQGNEDAS